jgi:protein-L-isoaspartate(D-aspartate) O-methyltransferase
LAALMADPFQAARLVLHLRQEGVTHDAVVRAMEGLSRAEFVDDPALAPLAYEDCVLPIPCGQIIPRPAITGHLLQALNVRGRRDMRLLLIGTGSGYTAALAAQLFADVFSVERYRRLAEAARQRMIRLGLTSVSVRHEDGLFGWPERGPYDRILLTGAVREVPSMLADQLARGGFIVAPIAGDGSQTLMRLDSDGSRRTLPMAHAAAPLIEGRAVAL